ncbi:MAG: DNA (cytosine-5-)-methyltransferase [Theionarchaea archaeon]|nr:DNA (cytosine-5-)-methyltransferase [Theionarchaea archaeon]
MKEKIRFIDLFGGIGGFRLGIEKATTWKCVWYNDIDPYAVKIYNKNFGETYEPRDIKQIHESEIPEHDLICAGFPCQSFSVAGKRGGMEDTRGTLFYEICRIVRHHRPQYLFLENVRGLLSSSGGNDFRRILQCLWELGYDVEWQVLDSKDFGVAQHRERVYIVGHFGGFCGRQVFPIRHVSSKSEIKKIGLFTNYNQDAVIDPYGICATLLKGDSMPRGAPIILLKGIEGRMKCRKMIPAECEKLQGFPRGWTAGVSDLQRYNCLGNSVTVNVIEAIAKVMVEKFRV